MIPMSSEVLKEEIVLSMRILTKWQQRIDQGIPGRDLPAMDETAVEAFTRELVAELLVVSGKLENVANIISADES
jgi:hypothetical protein